MFKRSAVTCPGWGGKGSDSMAGALIWARMGKTSIGSIQVCCVKMLPCKLLVNMGVLNMDGDKAWNIHWING